MMDPIERGEARCEAWYAEAVRPDGRVKCQCGRLFNLEDGETLTSDPFGIPICRNCLLVWERREKL